MIDTALKVLMYIGMGLGAVFVAIVLIAIFGLTAGLISVVFTDAKKRRTIIDEDRDQWFQEMQLLRERDQRKLEQDAIDTQFFTIIEEYRNEIR